MEANLERLDLSQDPSALMAKHFIGLHSGGGRSDIRGGQTAADRMLSRLDIRGYASSRSEVLPQHRRGATGLSPYIRHNLLPLKRVWDAVQDAPFKDREKFRDELLWQEYARHLYARMGTRLFENLRFDQVREILGDGWNRDLLCIDTVVDELERTGWLVNQTRMWLASHWTVRNGKGWIHGQEAMYRHLLDGSRAANLLGWQWTVGSAGKPYGFGRWQVEKRAPGLCGACPLNQSCPIEDVPAQPQQEELDLNSLLNFDPNLTTTTGPLTTLRSSTPTEVLLTVDSLGDSDPALIANPNLPVVFVFNREALARLQLSSKRMFFYLETLKDLNERRHVRAYIGNPYEYSINHAVALTYAPVPSFRKFGPIAELHPFLWLRRPTSSKIQSYSSWMRNLS